MVSDSPSNIMLNRKILDDKLLEKLCFGGVRDEYRPIVWRVIFQMVGLKQDVHEREIKSKDGKYFALLAGTDSSIFGCVEDRSRSGDVSVETSSPRIFLESLQVKDGSRSKMKRDLNIQGKLSINHRSKFRLEISRKTIHQIDIDIKRIDSRHKIHLGADISFIYYHILSLVAYRRPSLGYVQGMADILVPFVLVFSHDDIATAESSAYFCYCRLLDEIQHNIIELQGPLIKKLDSAIEMADPDFHRFLREIGLETHMFAFRWFNCFFIREFKFPVLYKILDTIFASGSTNELLVYFAVALLMSFKPVLIENDFAHNVLFLQNIYEREWEDAEIELLLSSAKFYRNTIHEHPTP